MHSSIQIADLKAPTASTEPTIVAIEPSEAALGRVCPLPALEVQQRQGEQ
jgi:hypothetical protein